MTAATVAPLLAITVACALANIGVAVADWRQAPFVMANSSEVGVASSAIPYLGAMKMAGGVGLLAGLVLTPWLGLAAAVGLVLFFTAAVTVHLRARVLHNIAFPMGYLGLAVCSAAYFATVIG
nr:DoxX family protein [Mycobacterium sp. SMC-4]